MEAFPTRTIQGITVDGSFAASIAAQLFSAEDRLATATASKAIASLSIVASEASLKFAVITEAMVAATATDPSAVASASAAIEVLINNPVFSYYHYIPSLPGNLVMLIVMGLVLGIQTFYAVKYLQYWYGSCFCIGIGLEFAGFISRVISHFQPVTNRNAYFCQIICLTIAPCFIMAALYCILAKLVIVYGERYSILKPIRYTQIFVASDFLSLALQGGGGGLAALAVTSHTSTHLGTYTMIAGLGLQVLSMTVFIVFWSVFFWRVYKASKLAEPGFDPRFEHLRSTSVMKLFPLYASVAVICIYVRSIYRVVELSEGWLGHLMTTELFFLVLDAALMAISGVVMSFPGAYPGIVVGSEVSVKKKNNEGTFSDSEKDTVKSTESWESFQGGVAYREYL